MIRIITILLSALLISSCSFFSGLDKKTEYPKSKEDERRARAGKLTGDGIKLFGGKGSDGGIFGGGKSADVGIGINSYLWRATLDTLSFMPLASADPFGGVIITEWYEDPAVPGERFKVNVVITDSELRVNAVKVSVFKQKYSNSRGWRDAEPSAKVATDLENKILTKARALRVERESE